MGIIHLFKDAAATYSATGERPDGEFWDRLAARRDLNPARFDRHHPTLAGLFVPAECVGELPETGLFAVLRERFEETPRAFERFHPFWWKLYTRESLTVCPPPIVPPPTPCVGCEPTPHVPPVAVPEPGSLTLASVGFACCLLFVSIRRRMRR
jgi:hypothetical protein